ncbi:MAG: hypothetical protein M3O35_11700 [Acidobacteriota bacterium]|nr:hypothetical protein [Acidobacteriota bacterium]
MLTAAIAGRKRFSPDDRYLMCLVVITVVGDIVDAGLFAFVARFIFLGFVDSHSGSLSLDCSSEKKALPWEAMKPAPAPDVPGTTEFERFDNAVRTVFSVTKKDLLKAEEKWKRDRAKKKRAKKP